MTTTGMNVAEVRQLAQQLVANGEKLRSLVSTIDGRVHSSSWVGRDADRFRHEWWPQHRSALLNAAEAIEGLGRSASNNADEQERASAVGGSGAPAGTLGGVPRELLVAAGLVGGAVSGSVPALIAALRRTNPLLAAQALAAFIKNPSMTWSATQGWQKDFWSKEASGGTRLGGVVPASYNAQARVYGQLDATESVTIDKNGLAATAEAGALIGARAEASGSVGNEYVGADGRVYAEAVAGAQANAGVHLDRSGELTAGADGQVGAYTDVGADAHVHAAGVEAGAHGQVEAGAEAHIGATGSVGLHEVKAHVEMGASLGWGAGVSFDVDVKPDEVAKSAAHAIGSWKGLLGW